MACVTRAWILLALLACVVMATRTNAVPTLNYRVIARDHPRCRPWLENCRPQPVEPHSRGCEVGARCRNDNPGESGAPTNTHYNQSMACVTRAWILLALLACAVMATGTNAAPTLNYRVIARDQPPCRPRLENCRPQPVEPHSRGCEFGARCRTDNPGESGA
uniref:Uncharacterized protein n=1 Tax=Ananas comosus var. bracteatus TaxID=296719 RepID=A0A6V7NN90_ANACO|nr:unnamed protein product [Ananas comosus var. bracteatus]